MLNRGNDMSACVNFAIRPVKVRRFRQIIIMNSPVSRFFTLYSALFLASALSATTITIDPGVTHQTIRGWGCVNSLPDHLNPDYRRDMIHEMVNEFGLNRLRVEIPAGNRPHERRWEWFNDNTDPMDTDWTKFEKHGLDVGRVEEFVGPFAQFVRDNNEPFDYYLSFSFYDGGSSGTAPAWLLDNPGEYVEFAMTLLSRLKYVHGLEADYICILNEAGYNNAWNIGIVQEKIKTLGPVMEAAGMKTKIEFPESLNPDVAMGYIDQVANDDEMWSWVGVVSYHRYGGLTRLGELADFAKAKGLPTAFTEHSNTTFDRLYDDLTRGNVSYWEVYGLGSEIQIFDQPTDYIQLVRKGYYWRFRQVFHYVRPGAVRVDASSDNGGTVLGFVDDGKTTLVFTGLAGAVDITGLTPGVYGMSSSRTTASYVEHGLRTVGAGGTLSLTGLDSARHYTLYPYGGVNEPPTFTNYIGSPAVLVSPTSSLTLTAAAQDTELNAISYHWAVTDAPVGANVSLATPNAASCGATGLTVPGVYTFTVTASDATGSTQRRVRCEVFASNPAPVVNDLHNRIPVIVTLPTTTTTLRSGGFDANGDTLSYQWSIVSQPIGANAQFATPTTQNSDVSGMTVAGDYVFRISISDGTTTVIGDHTVPVYPASAKPSVSAGASPTSITLPVSSVNLTSTSSDPEGSPLTHWWRTKTKPVGARPVFATPGQANTLVSGLIVPGSYVFEHIVADESQRNAATVTVTVNNGAAPQLLYVTAPRGGETYEPGQAITVRWTTANFTGDVKIEYYDGSAWQTIIASTTNDGMAPWTLPAANMEGLRVRVSDAVDGNPMAESVADFRIRGPEEFKILELVSDFDNGSSVTWSALPGGFGYQLFSTQTLQPNDWLPVGPLLTAAPGELELTYQDTGSIGEDVIFYRVEETQ